MHHFYRTAILALFLAIATIATAATDYDFADGGIYYKVVSLDQMTVGVTAGPTAYSYSGKVEIPSTVSYNGKTFTVTRILTSAFKSSNATEVILPSTLRIIGNHAFDQSKSLKTIDLPTQQPLIINQYAFAYSGIKNIVLGDNVTVVGSNTFYNCKSLKSAVLGESITEVPNYIFDGCTVLESVKMGTKVTSIGTSAFNGCSQLTEITIPATVESIGTYCFSNCSELISITLPQNLMKIESSTFYKCLRLTEITIPDKVRTLGVSVFSGCTRLKKVTLGAKIEEIGNNCFQDCPALTEIAIRNPEPPTCKAFETKQYMDITVKVPGEAVADYKAAPVWKNFWNIEAIGSSSVEQIAAETDVRGGNGCIFVSAEVAAQGVCVYDIAGRCRYAGTESCIEGLPHGMYIVKTATSSYKLAL